MAQVRRRPFRHSTHAAPSPPGCHEAHQLGAWYRCSITALLPTCPLMVSCGGLAALHGRCCDAYTHCMAAVPHCSCTSLQHSSVPFPLPIHTLVHHSLHSSQHSRAPSPLSVQSLVHHSLPPHWPLQVLHALVALGHSSPLLDTLLSAAADAAGPEGPQLLDQLTPPDAAKLLARLQAILVDFAGDPVNMQGTVIQGAAGAD